MMVDLRNEVEQLRIRQQLQRSKPHVCPYDPGYVCRNPESWNCEVPIYLGDGHHTVIGYDLCLKRRRGSDGAK